jgi:hypothetical protein
MDIRQAAQTIRDSVTMDRILDIYGYKTRHGFMCCPFHGEKAPSLKVYPTTGGWHCFGCGKGGSVIDFVMEHEGCNFRTAVIAIDKALGLQLTDPHEDAFRAADNKRLQDALDDFCQAVYAYCDAVISRIDFEQIRNHHRMNELEDMRTDERIQQITVKDWDFIENWAENDQYDEYRKDRIREFKEEVAAWRRKARKAPSA